MKAQSENQAPYIVNTNSRDTIIQQALAILDGEMRIGASMTSPQAVRDYLILQAGAADDQYVERFGVMFLDSQNNMIKFEHMFAGTLTQTSIYPREVVRRALHHNAAAVILSHNHPSGTTSPSRADEHLTQTLKAALALVDVRVLDHIITAGGRSTSMAEMGLV